MTERFGKATGPRARAYHGVKLREQCPISKNTQIEPNDRIGALVTDKTEFPEKSPQGKVETLSPFSVQSVSSVTKPEKSRSDLIKKYDLPADLDLKGYIRFTVKDAVCLCKGCGAPAMWQGPDKALPRPFCDHHYRELMGADHA